MKASEEREQRIRMRHLEKERSEWQKLKAAMENGWDALYPNFDEGTIIHDVKTVGPFVVQHFNPEERGAFGPGRLGYANSLAIWARHRLRSRYHMYLTSLPHPGFSEEGMNGYATMHSWNPFLQEPALLDAIRFACGVDYAVTLSTPRGGASLYNFHFLAMPRHFRFRDYSTELYSWLDRYANTWDCSRDAITRLDGYPAVCVRVLGEHRYVSDAVWHLAKNYNNLTSYNLIVLRVDDDHAKAYFFPRPFMPWWEGPRKYTPRRGEDSASRAVEHVGWTFGSFEMGGFFVQGDGAIYRDLDATGVLEGYLREVSISSGSREMKRLDQLLDQLHGG